MGHEIQIPIASTNTDCPEVGLQGTVASATLHSHDNTNLNKQADTSVHIRLLIILVSDEMRARWVGGSLSWAWAVAQPLAQIALYSVVFTTVMTSRMQAGLSQHFWVYLCIGIFPWIAVSETIARSTTCISEQAGTLRRAYLPLWVMPARVSIASWVLAIVALILVLCASMVSGVSPSWCWLLIPIPVVSLGVFSFGVAAGLAGIGALVRDLAPFVSCLLPLILWSAPIIYVPEILPHWAQSIQRFHPLTPALTALHQLVIESHLPENFVWLMLAGWTVAALVIGLTVLRQLDSEVRDGI